MIPRKNPDRIFGQGLTVSQVRLLLSAVRMNGNIATLLENHPNSESTAPFKFNNAASETYGFTNSRLSLAAAGQADWNLGRSVTTTGIRYRHDGFLGFTTFTTPAGFQQGAMVVVVNTGFIASFARFLTSSLRTPRLRFRRCDQANRQDPKNGDERPLGHGYVQHSKSPKKYLIGVHRLGQVKERR